MNARVENTNQFTNKGISNSNDDYYTEAKNRIELLRIMGLLDGPVNVSVEEVQQWCKDRDNDPKCTPVTSHAYKKVLELE